jgi:hypothetical protein
MKPLLIGAAAAAIAAAAWVLITALADGTTYHLFPLLIGAAAPVVARYVVPDPLSVVEAAIATAAGAIAWLAGWAVLVAIDQWPSATFLEDQPGGVEGETIVFGLAGAVIGLLYAANRRSSS